MIAALDPKSRINGMADCMTRYYRKYDRLFGRALILCGIFFLSALTTTAAKQQGDYEYSIDDGNITITGYTAKGGDITVPGEIDGIPVTAIKSRAFLYCSGLKSIAIPDSVTEIDHDAFRGCRNLTAITVGADNRKFTSKDGILFNKDQTDLLLYPARKAASEYAIPHNVTEVARSAFNHCMNLTSVTIPDSVTTIGHNAFSGCMSLANVTMGNSVMEIGRWAFRYCTNLTSVIIPDNVTSIGRQTFIDCRSLKSAIIGNSVTEIGYDAFIGCTNLTTITVASDNRKFTSLDGVLFNKDQTTLLLYPAGKAAGEYSIPSSVTSIERDAFRDCTSLTRLTISDSVTEIGFDAFWGCTSLARVTIPDSVMVDDSTFRNCTSLTAIEVDPENPNQSSLNGVLFNSDQTTLLFCPEGKAGDYTIPDGVTAISKRAFLQCKGLKSITIPDSVTEIGQYAFVDCTSLTAIEVDPDNQNFSSMDGIFFNKDQTTLLLYPAGKSADEYVVPASVTKIENHAFWGCTNLTRLTIPDSVTKIANNVFGDCRSLTTVDVDPENPSYTSFDGVLFNSDQTSLLFCPEGKAGDYTIPDSTTSVLYSSFLGCSNLTSVVISDGVTEIGSSAFLDCESLSKVRFGNSVVTIQTWAFRGCASLQSATIPDSVKSIGDFAFWGCTSLTSVNIPDSISSIGERTFRDCSSLTRMTIPDSVTEIGVEAFSGCSNLTEVTIGSSVVSIGIDAFKNCSRLTEINVDADNPNYTSLDGVLLDSDKTTLILYPAGQAEDEYAIPAGVTEIEDWAFYGCTNLASVTIGNSVTEIGQETFRGCTNLTSVIFKGKPPVTGDYAFFDSSATIYYRQVHKDSWGSTFDGRPTIVLPKSNGESL